MNTHLRTNLHIIRVLALRNFLDNIFSIGIYIAISGIVAGASFILLAFRNVAMQDHLLVLNSPFNFALIVAAILLSTYLGVVSCTTISRERENGTLFILFTGPVNRVNFILGHYLSQILSLSFIMFVLLVDFILVALFTEFILSPYILVGVVYSVVVMAGVIMLGAFLAVAIGKNKAAVLSLLIIVSTGILLQSLDGFLYAPGIQSANPTLLIIGNVAHTLNSVFEWISPFSYLVNGLQAFSDQNWALFFTIGLVSISFSVIFFLLCLRAFEIKGVRPL